MKLTRNLLHKIMIIAQEMTEIGSEISRVEESIDRMCCAYGAQRADVFATTSNIIVSVEDEQGVVITQTRRIKQRISNNMEKLHQYNALVRWITETAPDEATLDEHLAVARFSKTNPVWLVVLSNSFITASFCLFFGSRTYQDCLVALIVGATTGILSEILERCKLNPIMIRFVCAFTASLIALVSIGIGFIKTPEYVLIGNIMTLIPGVGLTNAMRDLFAGDVFSGILRSIEAVLFTLAIAFGMMLPNLLFGGMM